MNTTFLFLMGGSGCGKTTLAKKLQEYDPAEFYRNIEYGSRSIREGEIDGFDYNFITADELERLYENGDLFESVRFQFPDKYGCNWNEIKENKINVVITSIEGFLTAAKSLSSKSKYKTSRKILVNIINDCELDILRDGRDPLFEERINKSVLYSMLEDSEKLKDGTTIGVFANNILYCELLLSELKTFRNDKEKCLEYFKKLLKF